MDAVQGVKHLFAFAALWWDTKAGYILANERGRELGRSDG